MPPFPWPGQPHGHDQSHQYGNINPETVYDQGQTYSPSHPVNMYLQQQQRPSHFPSDAGFQNIPNHDTPTYMTPSQYYPMNNYQTTQPQQIFQSPVIQYQQHFPPQQQPAQYPLHQHPVALHQTPAQYQGYQQHDYNNPKQAGSLPHQYLQQQYQFATPPPNRSPHVQPQRQLSRPTPPALVQEQVRSGSQPNLRAATSTPPQIVRSSNPPPDHLINQTYGDRGSHETPVLRTVKQDSDSMPSSSHRVLDRVEIRVDKSPAASVSSQNGPVIKRRRSNEGNAIPVNQQVQAMSAPQTIDPSMLSKGPVITKPLAKPAIQIQPQKSASLPPDLSEDYQSILLGLADEYLEAAYHLVSSQFTKESLEHYHRLLAAAMSCLQSILTNYRGSEPRKEARIQLRLASLLVEETENAEAAETLLTKGIALCDRNRLPDIKYTMHYLLILQEFQTSPKRALKAIDNMLKEVTALNNVNWIYVVHFLRISLAMQMGNHTESPTLLRHLSSLSAMAEEHRHTAVRIMVAVLESLVHLASTSSDAMELARTAIAAARTHQLSKEMQHMPQIQVLLDCIDLACALQGSAPDQVTAKMQQMQQTLDSMPKDTAFSKDGVFEIELGPTSNDDLEADTRGLMRKMVGSRAAFPFQWLSRSEVYSLGFILSAHASMYTNGTGNKAAEFVADGLKMVDAPPERIQQSLSASVARSKRRNAIAMAMRLHEIYAKCCHYEWQDGLDLLLAINKDLFDASVTLDEHTNTLLSYQMAICTHGLGDLDGALQLYSSELLKFDASQRDKAIKDLRALATLNRILIIRARSQGSTGGTDELLKSVEQYSLSHPNQSMRAALHTVIATAKDAKSVIVKTKKHLQLAIQSSKEAKNQQLLCIVMNVMSSMFFNNIIGEQAEKSFRAGRSLAKVGQDKLWLAVADGMYADNAARTGRITEARKAEDEAREAMMSLPALVRQEITRTE